MDNRTMASTSALGTGFRDAQTARIRFRLRSLTNFVLVIFIFVLGVSLLAREPWRWYGDLVLGGALFGFFFFILEGRSILLRCSHCGETIESNTPWKCGVCHGRNLHTEEFSFLNRCEACTAEPKSYRCHHCQELLYLSKDENSLNYASCLNSPDELPKPDEQAEKAKKYKALKEEKKEELEILEIERQLRAIRKRIKDEKPKPAGKALKENVDKFMSLEEEADKMKAQYAKKYKGDEGKIERYNAAIDECVRRQKAEDY